MSVHVGNHAGAHRAGKKKGIAVLLWTVAIVVSVYGTYAFVTRDMASYLILKNQFVFFDFGQSLLRFMADYGSMMCLFACIGAALSKGLKMLNRPKRGISKDE